VQCPSLSLKNRLRLVPLLCRAVRVRWFPLISLLRRDTCKEFVNVALGREMFVCCCGFGDAEGPRVQVDPGGLVRRGRFVQARVKGKVKDVFVQIVKLGGSGMEGDNGRAQFGFAFELLVRFVVDPVQIGVAQFPGRAQMRPQMVEDLLEPALAGEERGTIWRRACWSRIH
jgi:hypothetical protein